MFSAVKWFGMSTDGKVEEAVTLVGYSEHISLAIKLPSYVRRRH